MILSTIALSLPKNLGYYNIPAKNKYDLDQISHVCGKLNRNFYCFRFLIAQKLIRYHLYSNYTHRNMYDGHSTFNKDEFN